MKKGYWTVAYRAIPDVGSLHAYAADAKPAIEAYDGKVIGFSGDDLVVREQGVAMLTVIVEFPSAQQARDCYDSAAYQAAVGKLAAGTERDLRIFEGVA